MNSGKDEHAAVEAEAERDEQEDRRGELAVLAAPGSSTTGCLLRGDSSHQTIAIRQTPDTIASRRIHGVGEPVVLLAFLEHVLQRAHADRQQADAEPVDLPGAALLVGRIVQEGAHQEGGRRCRSAR